MKKIVCLLCISIFFVQPIFAQEKKSRKELKLERKKAKFDAQKEAMEIGQFSFAIRKVLSSNKNSSDFGGGILYVRKDEGQLDEVLWHTTDGIQLRLNADFEIENYYVVTSNNGQKMTASYQGTAKGKRYSFKTEVIFGEKPKHQIKSSDGVEIWYTGIFDTRN